MNEFKFLFCQLKRTGCTKLPVFNLRLWMELSQGRMASCPKDSSNLNHLQFTHWDMTQRLYFTLASSIIFPLLPLWLPFSHSCKYSWKENPLSQGLCPCVKWWTGNYSSLKCLSSNPSFSESQGRNVQPSLSATLVPSQQSGPRCMLRGASLVCLRSAEISCPTTGQVQ